uniref:Uncharacterized protein n=1 Tax=Utricularia reniformis TaxID=192314 RepID=A0A1Y0B0P4_9LAMI|nr:hypothetical protein AEK19_MT0780 [Utricularia reniformis]ART31022.1 hypothetical protein AEK19_MT0780 [Utricularia reniformis]
MDGQLMTFFVLQFIKSRSRALGFHLSTVSSVCAVLRRRFCLLVHYGLSPPMRRYLDLALPVSACTAFSFAMDRDWTIE